MKLVTFSVILGFCYAKMNTVPNTNRYTMPFELSENSTNPYFRDRGVSTIFKYYDGTCDFPLNVTECENDVNSYTGTAISNDRTVLAYIGMDDYEFHFDKWEFDNSKGLVSRSGGGSFIADADDWAIFYICVVNVDTACNKPSKVDEMMSAGKQPFFQMTIFTTECYIAEEFDPYGDGIPYDELMRCAVNGTLMSSSNSAVDYYLAYGYIVYDSFTGILAGQEVDYGNDYSGNPMGGAILCEWILRQEVNGIYLYGLIPNLAMPGFYDYYNWPFHVSQKAWTVDDCEYWVGIDSNPYRTAAAYNGYPSIVSIVAMAIMKFTI